MAALGPAAGLTDLLRAKRTELEDAAMARVYAISDPTNTGDPAYVAGLREAVEAAIDYGIANLETSQPESPPPVPEVLLAQARRAARTGVSLDTVLRRYCGGYALLGDFSFKVAREANLQDRPELQRLLAAQAARLDRLLAEISEEYLREVSVPARSPERNRAERVRRLLDGELLGSTELGYELAAWHIGAVAEGAGAEAALRKIAALADRRLLLVRAGGQTLWTWFGGLRRIESQAVMERARGAWPAGVRVAFGEPGKGTSGWRLTHRQAVAAMGALRHSDEDLVHYREVAVLSSALRDDVLCRSLEQLYLEPLAAERDGAVLRETLRAYFAAQRQASGASAALGVTRQTVNNRLRSSEKLLGVPLGVCGIELEVALRLQAFSKRHGE